MNLSMLFKLAQVLMTFGNVPLVQKFVDNAVKGTTTQVDDWLWRVLKAFLMGGSINDLEPQMADVQAKYDADKTEAKKPALIDFEVG